MTPLRLVVALPVLVWIGCIDTVDNCVDTGSCPPPDTDAGPSSDPCPGICFPGTPGFVGGPYLVWLGESAPPSDLCAVQSFGDFFDGTASPAPELCPQCSCSVPTGSCALPTMATPNTSTCPTIGLSGDPLEAPIGWDGSCYTGSFLIEGNMESVTITPVLPVKETCAPHITMNTKYPPPNPPPLAKTWPHVHACKGSATGSCSPSSDVCEPALPAAGSPPVQFQWTYCVSLEEPSAACPVDTFPIRRDVSDGWTDVPTCTLCTCGAAVDSSCSPSTVTLYSDDACTDEIGPAVALTSTARCVDVEANALGSMTATPSVYTPGHCPYMGGDLTGGPAIPAAPMTFCCQE